MTPDKDKLPLPSSTSIVFLERPKTQHEWRYVLKVLKVEYQNGQWKRCLTRCSRLLSATSSPLPLHVACLHFYAALSEEAMARQMHIMSMAKVVALQNAKSSFEQAISSLPVPEKSDNGNNLSSADSGSEVDDTASLEDSVSSVEEAPGSPATAQVELPSPISHALRPLPLKICKVAQTPPKVSFNDKRAFFESRLRATNRCPKTTSTSTIPANQNPLLLPPPQKQNLPKSSSLHSNAIILSDSTMTSATYAAREHYNDQLRDFAEMLAKHVESVNDTMIKTQEAQTTGRRRLIKERKRIGDEEEDERAADLSARIAKLKAKGWLRERFMPERYQTLCEKALMEL